MGEKKSSENNKKTIYLIDGSGYIHRAYHAIRGLSNSEGLPTNAIFGFTRMLIKLLKDKDPRYVVMLHDAKGPTFRHEMYDDYKANRPPMPEDLAEQIPYIKKITEGFNIPAREKSGYEADDLIGTLARKAQEEGFSVVMVTGDKDFMQLVTEDAVIWDPMKDKTITQQDIRDKFGLEPEQMVDVMGLSGDSSDNIPGVPGVGPKTGQDLIKIYGDMDRLYEKVDEITKKKQKENLKKNKEQAYLSRKLVKIDTDAPVSFDADEFSRSEPDREKLADLFKKLEFKQLQQEYFQDSEGEKKKYGAILDESSLNSLIEDLKRSKRFAIDTETTSEIPMKARLVGLSFAMEPHKAFYIPCGHDNKIVSEQLDMAVVLKKLKPLLEDPALKKVGQNIKYDKIVLERHGMGLDGTDFDTMVASYLINPSKRAHNLDQIAMDFLNHKTITFKEVTGTGKDAPGFAEVPLEKAVPYACEDADITLMAADILEEKLEKIGLTELFKTVEIPLIGVLARMEMNGIQVDAEKLLSLSKAFESQLDRIEGEIYSLAGEKFNINSSQQLGYILFDKLKLPTQKKTKKKTGYSTDVSVLTTLAPMHELPDLVLRHRTLGKLKSTYTDALMGLINPETGRIHTSFNQTITATGRLSSSEPNLQNIPIRTDEGRQIRGAFIPRRGWRLLAADYSQIELRILAHYSEDEILIRSFKDDEDIHARTAAEVFQVFPSMLDNELRRQAKVINFGIIYGMSAYRLSNELGISRKMAATYIKNYFARYKGVKRFIDETIARARKTKKSSTLLGRIRLLPEIDSANKIVREAAERTAINTPIQGTAADLIKLAMIKADAELRKNNLRSAMLLTVHDELVFEAPPEEIGQVTELVRDVMENVFELRVPLKVNIQEGKNWAEAH